MVKYSIKLFNSKQLNFSANFRRLNLELLCKIQICKMNHRHALIILYAIIVGVISGIIAGWYWENAMIQFSWIGKLFLNMLKMTIVPLVVTSIVSSVASLGEIRKLGKLGGITLAYYFITTSIAVIIGLVVVNTIQPGANLHIESVNIGETIVVKEKITGLSDIFLSMVSSNLVNSASKTELLPLILFSLLFGAAITTLGKSGNSINEFFNGANRAMLKLVGWIMYLSPLGIFSLVSTQFARAGGGDGFVKELIAVGLHIVTVLSGLAIHFIVLLLILKFVAHRGRYYLSNMLRALLTAFGTASSSATLPITMECVRENRVEDRVMRFTLPLGSTVNMDGTALYEAAAAMFIAQAYGIDMGLGAQITIFITATLAAIGAAGIPEAGLVTMIIVLNAVGLPNDGIALLLTVDWFLDRFRTLVNVWGDGVGAAVVDKYVSYKPDR